MNGPTLTAATDHLGRDLGTLERCALHKRTLRLTCPACGRVRLLGAVSVWWLFRNRCWDDRVTRARLRFRCEPCAAAGSVVRPDVAVTLEAPDGDQPPYPPASEWRRLVSRYRS